MTSLRETNSYQINFFSLELLIGYLTGILGIKLFKGFRVDSFMTSPRGKHCIRLLFSLELFIELFIQYHCSLFDLFKNKEGKIN